MSQYYKISHSFAKNLDILKVATTVAVIYSIVTAILTLAILVIVYLL